MNTCTMQEFTDDVSLMALEKMLQGYMSVNDPNTSNAFIYNIQDFKDIQNIILINCWSENEMI